MRMSRSSAEVPKEHTGICKAVDKNVVDVKVGVQGVDGHGHNELLPCSSFGSIEQELASVGVYISRIAAR